MGGFARGSRGGRGGRFATRGHPSSRYRPPPAEISNSYRDLSAERATNVTSRGPPTNLNRTFQE